MGNEKVENKAVREVEGAIEESDRLKAYITKNDKTPSWDGEVIVYRDSSGRKDKIKGRVPVQVKGKTCDDLTKSQISFSMDIADLKNYYKNGGCVLFVVYIAKDFQKTKIYYNDLTQIKLRYLLCNKKEGQKEKSVELKEFPSEKEEIENIFGFFTEQSKRQASFVLNDAFLSSSDVDNLQKRGLVKAMKLSCPCSSSEPNDWVGAWLNNDFYIYVQIDGCKAWQPVDVSPEQTILKVASTGKIFMIEIDGKRYGGGTVLRSKERKNNEKIILSFLDGIVLALDADQMRKDICHSKIYAEFTIERRPNRIDMVVRQLDFLLAALKKGYFSVIGDKCGERFKMKCGGGNIQKLEGALRRYKKVEELFKMLHCADDANINDMKNEDWNKLNVLMSGLLDKKPIKIEFKDDSAGNCTCYEVGKLKFLIGLEKCSEKGEYKIYDFFSPDFQFPSCVLDDECPEKTFPISRYVYLQENALLTLSNIDFDGLIKDWKDKVSDRVTFGGEHYRCFLGSLLNAYDKATGSRKEKLLKVCKELVNWMKEPLDYKLNERDKWLKTLHTCEIIKRYRELTAEERRELWSIACCKNAEQEIITIAYWLLGEQKLAKEESKKLSKEDQEILKKALSF